MAEVRMSLLVQRLKKKIKLNNNKKNKKIVKKIFIINKKA